LLFRPLIAILFLASLAGCGFQPLYGRQTQNAEVQQKLAATYIAPISGRTGQMVRNELLDLMTPKGVPARSIYRLSVELKEESQSLAIDPDNTTNRKNLTLKGTFALLASDGKTIIYQSSAQSTSSFNLVTSDFANLSAEKNARTRSALVLAEKIHRQISVYLAR
jgi:LPS-assembly lipoprotein